MEIPFDLWYAPDYPLDKIRVSTKVYREDFEKWRPALAQNISEWGLVNPLIVLNHRSGKYNDNWLKIGNNRYWALRYLGWSTAPVLITGYSDYGTKVTLEEAKALFMDGELYYDERTDGGTLRIRNFSDPSKFEFPNDRPIHYGN